MPNRKYQYKKGSKVRKAKQAGGAALLVPTEQEQDMPIDTYPNIPPEEEAALEASQVPDEQMEEDYLE